MMPLRFADPATLPSHVLFPEQYRASARQAAFDLAGFALAITVAIVGAAVFFHGSL
jgi:hypothetical protein